MEWFSPILSDYKASMKILDSERGGGVGQTKKHSTPAGPALVSVSVLLDMGVPPLLSMTKKNKVFRIPF